MVESSYHKKSSGTYLGQSYFELSKKNIENTRSKIHERITHLYGPIVGNRLLHKAALQVRPHLTLFDPI